MLFEKTENKLKRGRSWRIFRKKTCKKDDLNEKNNFHFYTLKNVKIGFLLT